jgi:hypothetical protein
LIKRYQGTSLTNAPNLSLPWKYHTLSFLVFSGTSKKHLDENTMILSFTTIMASLKLGIGNFSVFIHLEIEPKRIPASRRSYLSDSIGIIYYIFVQPLFYQ